jgi:two-component system OmpR family sensor kinase
MTLATRISMFFLAALAVVLLGFSVSIYLLAHSHLYRRTDERAAAALDTLTAAIESGPAGLEWEVNGRLLDVDQSMTSEPLEWSVIDEHGARVDGTKDSSEMLAALDQASSREGQQKEDIAWKGETWRIARREFQAKPPTDGKSRALIPRDDDPTAKRYSALVITVGTSLSRLSSQLRTLALVLTGLSLAIWLSAAFFGRWLCRNALSPLTRMADSMATISADDLTQRLSTVDSGDELEELSRAFNQLLDRLQTSFERQRRFSAEASHQMRTPLTAMLGQLDVSMRRGRSTDEYLQTLKSVHEQTINLQRIMEMLLFLTREGTEAAPPQFERLELNDWVENHLAHWREHPRGRDLQIETEPSALLWIQAHPGLLGQVLDNLIDNACKYSDPNSPITIRTAGSEREVRLIVEDCGYGIKTRELSRVVDPFFRSDDARMRGIGGTGLGLSIVQKIVDAFGATLHVESNVGLGSTFAVVFPSVASQQLHCA